MKIGAILFVLLLLPFELKLYANDYATLITELREYTGEPVESVSIYTDKQAWRWIASSQDELAKTTDALQAQTDLTYGADSILWYLPGDFREEHAIMLKASNRWTTAFLNPFFTHDTSAISYFVHWKNADTAALYLKVPTESLDDGDIIRLFYRPATTVPTDSVDFLDSLDLDDEWDPWILEKAAQRYLAFKIGIPSTVTEDKKDNKE